jgi:O-antigen/teichoic acid export membrane protein
MVQRFAYKTAYSTAAGLVVAVGRFATLIAMARVLGVEETGVAAFALWLVSLIGAVTNLGVYTSLTRYLPELKSYNDARRLTCLLLLPYVGIILSVALFAAILITRNLDWVHQTVTPLVHVSVHVIVCLYVVQSLASFGLGYLIGRQEFHIVAALAIVSNLLQFPLVIGGGLKWGVDGVLWGYIAGALPFAVLCMSLIFWRPSLPTQLRKRLFRYATYSWAATLANELVWARLEMAFLSYLWGSTAVGLYSVGFTLASLATQGPLLLTGALLPYFAEAMSDIHRMERAKIMLQSAMRLIAFFVLPLCFGVAAIVPEILPLLYGNSFASGASSAVILVSAAGLGANIVVPLNFINGMERSDFLFVVNIVAAMMSVALGLMFVYYMGVVGAALARASIQIFLLSATFWFLRCRLACPLPLRDLGLLFVSALSSACTAVLIALSVSGLSGLFLAILAATLVYPLFVRLLRAMPTEDFDRMAALFERLPVPLQRGISAARILLGSARPVRSEALED